MNTCAPFCSVSCAELEKSAPSCLLMLPTNLLFLSFSLDKNIIIPSPENKLNKLQRIQNDEARLVLRKSRHASATALLRTLHWRPVKTRTQYKIAFSVFSVSIRTDCYLIFLTFFIHNVPLGRCSLLTPLCGQILASLLRPLENYLSLFLDPLSGTPYHYPSEKHSVLRLSKRNLRPIFLKFICAEV